MIEVFKTNVCNGDHANILIDHIQKTFIGYKANFDLDDCDKILRVKNTTGLINAFALISLLKELGVIAEILPDELEVHGPQSTVHGNALY
jgi:hypothetical protein